MSKTLSLWIALFLVGLGNVYAQQSTINPRDAAVATERSYWATCGQKYGVCGTVPGMSPPNKSLGAPSERDAPLVAYMLDQKANQIVAVDPTTGHVIQRSSNQGLPPPVAPSEVQSVNPASGIHLQFSGPTMPNGPNGPVDMSIAVNDSTDLITNTNAGISLYLYGNTNNPVTTDPYTFWCSKPAVNGAFLPGCSSGSRPFDTSIQLEPIYYHWVATALSTDKSNLYIAVSSSDTGSGPPKWNLYSEPACNQGSSILGDQPILGITNSQAFVDVRCFTPESSCSGIIQPDTIWDLNLTAMEKGQNIDPKLQVANPTVRNLRPVTTGSYDQIGKQWFAGAYIDNTGANVVLEYISASSTPGPLTYFTTINVDPYATMASLPLGQQFGCSGGTCQIETDFPEVTSAMTQVQTDSNNQFLFGTFAAPYSNPNFPTAPATAIELFGYNLNANRLVTWQDFTCPGGAYPSLVFNRDNKLYLHYAVFQPNAYAFTCNDYYTYYPLASFAELASGTDVSSSATFTGSLSTCFNAQRWGDYSGSNWVTNYLNNAWTANNWEIDEYTLSGTDQRTMINAFNPPQF